MVMNILAPSLLAADFGHMEKQLLELSEAGVDTVHLDVMDGMFVPNISFGAPVIKYVRKALPDAFLDIHMMVQNPLRYMDDMIKAGGNAITVHYEATEDPKEDLLRIRSAGIRAGIAISPDTPSSVLEDLLYITDMVLVMSVYPGFGNQEIVPSSFEKLKEVKKMVDDSGRSIDIEVDGGITLDNVRSIIRAGANVIVSGSAVFTDNIKQSAGDFLRILKEEESR